MKYFVLLRDKLTTFHRGQDGASAIEYAVIAGLIAVGIIVAAGTLGDGIAGLFDHIADELPGTTGGG